MASRMSNSVMSSETKLTPNSFKRTNLIDPLENFLSVNSFCIIESVVIFSSKTSGNWNASKSPKILAPLAIDSVLRFWDKYTAARIPSDIASPCNPVTLTPGRVLLGPHHQRSCVLASIAHQANQALARRGPGWWVLCWTSLYSICEPRRSNIGGCFYQW